MEFADFDDPLKKSSDDIIQFKSIFRQMQEILVQKEPATYDFWHFHVYPPMKRKKLEKIDFSSISAYQSSNSRSAAKVNCFQLILVKIIRS